MTKVPPAVPMNKRSTERPTALFTSPVQAVGMDAKHRTILKRRRAPTLSQSGPSKNRIKMVPPTPTMDEVQICSLVKSRDVRISDNSGAMANQMKKARKNAIQAQ